MNIILRSVSKQYQTANRQNVSFKANEQQVIDLMRQMKEGKLAINDDSMQKINVLAQYFEPKKYPDLYQEAKNIIDQAVDGAKSALELLFSDFPKP
jgi:hypothetical protein